MIRTVTAAIIVSLIVTSPALAIDEVNTTLFGKTAIEGYDAVAYFTDGEAVKGSKKISYRYLGATWRFATTEHRELFAANPDRYAPQYGGYCAFAVANGSTAGIDPRAFKVIEGKLYLNYSKTIQEQWEAGVPGFISKADANWPRLLKE